MSVNISSEQINKELKVAKLNSWYKKHIVIGLQCHVVAFTVTVFMTVSDYALKRHKSNYVPYKLLYSADDQL